MSFSPPQPVPRWLHAWAVLTAVVAAVLLALGAVVTTFRVGMADPVWPTYPWHLLLISWDEPSPGFVIEHTHRLAAYAAGFCVIVLAVGLWFAGPRRLAPAGARLRRGAGSARRRPRAASTPRRGRNWRPSTAFAPSWCSAC